MLLSLTEIFMEVEARLSANPTLRQVELAQQIKCSCPTIRKAVRMHAAITFREYQRRKLFLHGLILLQEGYKVREIGLQLGYKWPENFLRMVKSATGGTLKQLYQGDSIVGQPVPVRNV